MPAGDKPPHRAADSVRQQGADGIKCGGDTAHLIDRQARNDCGAGERVALMAEAAHVVPPIGAQGLNMSMADLGALIDLDASDPAALGTPDMLDRYHRRRHPEVLARVIGVDLLNRASMAGAQPLRDLRLAALNTLYGVPMVRRTLMRAGMGAGTGAGPAAA